MPASSLGNQFGSPLCHPSSQNVCPGGDRGRRRRPPIRSAPGRHAAWLLAFAVILAVSWFCRRRRIGGNLAHGAFHASFRIPIIVVPGIALESVHVSRSELVVRTGFWFSPTVTRIAHDAAGYLRRHGITFLAEE